MAGRGADGVFRPRLAGGFYLAVIVAGMFSLMTRSGMIVSGNPAMTAANILAAEHLYRLAFVADLAGTGCYLVVTLLLYQLFRPFDRGIALLAMLFSAAGCAIGALNQANVLAPLVLLGDAPYLAAFSLEQRQALSQIALKIYGEGLDVGLACFGIYCLLTGWLAFRSGLVPRAIGALLGVAGIGWLTGSLLSFLDPPLAAQLNLYLLLPGILGESALILWLLIKGADRSRWSASCAASHSSIAR